MSSAASAPLQALQLQTALYYTRLGWSVVPAHRSVTLPTGEKSCTCQAATACVSKGKHPAVNWMAYQQRCASLADIQAWFGGHFADYNVGIVTGTVSGFFVIDVDEGHGKPGGDTILNAQVINGDLPHTVQARTGGGGRHILLKHPGDIYIPTSKNVLGPGVDVRGDGGFIVAAPSVHESGQQYAWDENAHPRSTAIGTAPAWLLDMVCGAPGPDGSRHAPTGTGEIVHNAWGKVVDGRERHMIGIICGVIASQASLTGALPEAEAVFAEAWPSYERTTRARGASLEEDGRGETLMRQRIGHMLRRAASGKWKVQARPFVDEAAPIHKKMAADGGEAAHDPETGEVLEKPAKPARPAILSLAELDALPPPEWVVKDLIPETGLVVPYGPPKSGKTFIMLAAGLHVAAGLPWCGRAVKQGAVIYIAGEGVGGLSMRLKAMRQHYGISVTVPFWIVPRAVNFQNEGEVRALAELIRATAGNAHVRMIFIDTLARAMPGADENSAQEVGRVVAACDWLRDEFSAVILPIHHSGKDAERGARGTSALRGAWDAAFEIGGRGKTVRLKVADQKDAESGETINFDMVSVMVGLRTTLVPVVVDIGCPPMSTSVHPYVLSGDYEVAYQVLLHVIGGPAGAILPPFQDLPQNVRGVKTEDFRRSFYERLVEKTLSAKQKSFQRAVAFLRERKIIGTCEPYVWLVN